MTSRWRGVAGAASVALLMFAAACGSSSGSDESKGGDKALQYDSPLGKVLMGGFSAGSMDKAEQRVADCMVKKGWKYTPVRRDFDIAEMQLDPFDTQNTLFDTEFRTTWGYGVVTVYGDDGKKKEGAPGPDFSQLSNTVDPNVKYLESLSDEEKAQYNADLYGMDTSLDLPAMSEDLGGDGGTATTAASSSVDPNGDSGSSDLDADTSTGSGDSAGSTGMMDGFSKSCAGQAVGVSDMSRMTELYTQLDESMQAEGLDSTEKLVSKSADLKKAQTEWSECMGRAGVEAATVSDPKTQIEKEFSKLGGAGGIGAMLGGAEDDVDFPDDVANAPTDAANPDPSIPDLSADDLEAAAAEIASSAGVVTTAAGSDSSAGADTGSGSDADGGMGADEGDFSLPDFESLGGGFDPKKVDLAKIKALRAQELKTAQSDYECQKAGFRKAWIEARSAAEQRVLDGNKKLIAELSKLSAGTAETTTTKKDG